jgi:hypothetical protein
MAASPTHSGVHTADKESDRPMDPCRNKYEPQEVRVETNATWCMLCIRELPTDDGDKRLGPSLDGDRPGTDTTSAIDRDWLPHLRMKAGTG